jgi:transposase
VPKSHPPYPDEFREKAVQLVRSTDESIRKIADELGVSHQTLRNWVHQADVDAGKREGLTTEEREELRRLRRENKRLRMERDILGKATAFFANRGDDIR